MPAVSGRIAQLRNVLESSSRKADDLTVAVLAMSHAPSEKEHELMHSKESWIRIGFKGAGVALLSLLAAILVRKLLLSGLEGRIVWVTFYPAVVVAGMFGGWSSGMLVAVGSCLFARYAWPFLHVKPFIKDAGDWLGLYAFLFNCILISALAEMMRRAQFRALKENALAQEEKARADAASRAKSDFLASMSHELRTPMNAILGFTQILRREDGTSVSQREKLNIIHGAGEHLLAIINDILDLAKIESGKIQLELKEFDLGGLIEDLVAMLRLRAESKGLHLFVDQSSSFPRMVRADPAKLRQVLVNLVGNAIKFTKEGSVSVKLQVQSLHAQEDERLLHFEVRDTGCGITADDAARIFDPFVQLGTHEGTGLGLTITKQFIELMGGEISVESQPGKGTVVRFDIAYEPVSSEHVVPGSSRLQGIERVVGAVGARILVVEDNRENRLVVRGFLERFGFQIREAENGLEGLEIFRSWQPDLVLMDRRMPVMDGLQATRELRALPGGKDAVIVAVTAHAYQDERQEMLDAGCDAFLAKPVCEEDLVELIAKHLKLGLERMDSQDTPPRKLGEIAAEMLEGVPQQLLDELVSAFGSSDMARVDAQLALLSRSHPELNCHLAFYADRFEYSTPLRMLKEIAKPGGGP